VACHPKERCIATGDNTGRVLIWWNLLTSGKPTWAVYHWHALPVQAITFSQAGNILSCVRVTIDLMHVEFQ
jgi:NET1-associated nuclear protein 1 (U3 small nucleolar RNA-associated protein 17)